MRFLPIVLVFASCASTPQATAPAPDGIRTQEDVIYGRVEGSALLADVAQPPGDGPGNAAAGLLRHDRNRQLLDQAGEGPGPAPEVAIAPRLHQLLPRVQVDAERVRADVRHQLRDLGGRCRDRLHLSQVGEH